MRTQDYDKLYFKRADLKKRSYIFATATETRHRCKLNNTMKIAAEVF